MIKKLMGILFLAFSTSVLAVPITWTDWTAADATTATGTVGGVTVDFAGPQSPASQTSGGINYWATNSAIYRGGSIDNGPEASSDIIRITDATDYTITFSQAVVNPVMAVLSVGRPSLTVNYAFDQAFDIVNSGCGYWGGSCAGSLFEDPGNVLRGVEGHGVIQFTGIFTELNFTTNPAEFWHGFTFGIAAVAPPSIPEPGTLALLALGLVGLTVLRRRRA